MTKPPGFPTALAHLRVKHLLLLDHIEAEGSLRRVATRMHLTQPAVTAMLKDLEAAFHGQLVERSTQGALLTPRGRSAQVRLRTVTNALQALRTAGAVSDASRLLTVGAMPIALFDLAPKVLAALDTWAPGLTVHFIEQNAETTMNDLFNGRIDCAISRVDTATLSSYPSDAFVFEPLIPMRLDIVCGPQHPLYARRRAGKQPIGLAQLAQEQWTLLAANSQLRAAFDQAFVQAGMEPPFPAIESLSFASSLLVAARSRFLAIAPASTVSEFESLGVLRRVDFTWPVALSPLMLVRRKSDDVSPDLELFSGLLRRLFVGFEKNFRTTPRRRPA